MWRNYLTAGLRALLKNRTYAFVNILGLALGLAACLIILLYVRYELSYDRWIPGADRVFQLQHYVHTTPQGGPELKLQGTTFPARQALVKDFPQIENSVFLTGSTCAVIENGAASAVDHCTRVDANMFDVFRLPFVEGDPRHALNQPGTLVLTESEARKRFPHQNAMGRTLTLAAARSQKAGLVDYRVTGVIRDLPKNTHLRLGIIIRDDLAVALSSPPGMIGLISGRAYVRLRAGANAGAINAEIPAWKKRNFPDENIDGVPQNGAKFEDLKLVNITDIHLGVAQMDSPSPGGDWETVISFALIAALILGIAIINFINLATAWASQRAREVALRKVLGASRRQLIVQFLGESSMVTAFAMLLGLVLAELLLPFVDDFLDADMAISYFGQEGLLLPILFLILIVGLGAGLYPAFYLSQFQPAKVLKANNIAVDAQGSGRLRNLLVVGQFTVSIGLIICTAIIYGQTLYARTADAGYKREGLLQISNVGVVREPSSLQTFRQEANKISGVQNTAMTELGVNPPTMVQQYYAFPGKTAPLMLGSYNADPAYFDMMGMTLLAGRTFDERVARDYVGGPPTADEKFMQALRRRGANVIVSETAARNLGFTTPQSAIGQQGTISAGSSGEKMSLTIIGVVKDARLRTFRMPIEPVVYWYNRFGSNAIMIRYDGRQPNKIMTELKKLWRRLIPTVPFNAEFVDDRLREMYRADEARGQIFGAFALLAVVIGCLGLFGLAAFTAERRTKEIGIRKVLGARTRDIVRLLAWQFSKPVLIANLIAWPVAWWVMRDWLNGFDARIALSPAYFLLAGALALVIAIGTIAGHAFKVARAKPIRALRYE